MVHTRTSDDPILDIPEGSAAGGHGRALHGNAPPPPRHARVSLEQLLATQNDIMQILMANEMRRGAKRLQPRHQDRDSSYADFLATHAPIFPDATDPLDADNRLCTIESKIGLLQCMKFQKNLYATQQL
jgi:hypothetical protein